MPNQNSDIVAVFNQVADLLEIQDANPFRVRAYRNAARMLGESRRDMRDMLARGEDPDDLPGIGADLAGKIREIVGTGGCALLTRLRSELPPHIDELLAVPGLGPKRVRQLHDELGIDSVQQLHEAAVQGRLRALRGFGPRSAQGVLEATARHLGLPRRAPLAAAAQLADLLLERLRTVPGVVQAVAAGSLRRMKATVGDIDLLVAAPQGGPVVTRLGGAPSVQAVLLQGPTRASVRLHTGLQVDLRVVPAASFGAAWIHLTGSKAHNIALRRRARSLGLKVNEYGVFRGTERIASETEAAVYAALGLPFIEPELREDEGEIEAALSGQLPTLLTLADLRGDLHVRTRDGGGRDDLETLVAAAQARGWQYLAVADAAGPRLPALAAEALAAQCDHIDRLNERLSGFTVLKGAGVDILEDGRLSLPDATLARLDLVVGTLQEPFDLPRGRQTARLLRAMEHPHFSVLAHPSCRRPGEHDGAAVDLRRVLRHARERGCFVELDSQPAWLDLDADGCRQARDAGVPVCVSAGAGAATDFDALRWGVGQARRGWLGGADVLNSRPLAELRPLLAATM